MSEWKDYKLADLTIDGKGCYGIAAPAVEYDANKENKGILFFFSKFYDFKPDTVIELEKGEKVIINYSHNTGSCILASSNENMKELNHHLKIIIL